MLRSISPSPHRPALPLSRWTVVLAAMCWIGSAGAETLTVNGVPRTLTAMLPDERPAPLVIVLHGNTQTGDDIAARTSWPTVAKRERFGGTDRRHDDHRL